MAGARNGNPNGEILQRGWRAGAGCSGHLVDLTVEKGCGEGRWIVQETGGARRGEVALDVNVGVRCVVLLGRSSAIR
jgi:hypothetical protein